MIIIELGSMWKEAVVAIPAFAWGAQGLPRKIPGRMAGLRAEI